MTNNRCLIIAWVGRVLLTGIARSAADVLPMGSARPAIEFKHFPDRLHTFVRRNWEMVSL